MKKFFLGFTILIMVVGCRINAAKELEENVKVFLTDFQNKLRGSDEEIVKLFASAQNKDEILKAIAILQNKDTVVKAKIIFDSAKSSQIESYVVVQLPVDLTGNNQQMLRSQFSFQLFKNDGQFKIGKLEGEKLYSDFFGLKNSIENAEELARRMVDIKVYYERAHELQKDYDSVIWYVHHKNMTYYYSVKGNYNFDSLKKGVPQDYKMGLIDETGKVIVPVEFDLIGNPSTTLEETVEVRKNGMIGYYSLEGKEIIPASYEWLVPYEKGFANALVKKDSTFGWLDKDYRFHEKLPSTEAERTIKEFEYLTNNRFTIGKGHQDIINVLVPIDNGNGILNGNGLVISSAYFVQNGIWPLVNDNLVTTGDEEKFWQFGYAFMENTNEKPFSVSETVKAFISNIKRRYIGGRGEFYTEHNIILTDGHQNFLSVASAVGADFKFRKLSNELFESTSLEEGEVMGFGPSARESNFPIYTYFRLDGVKLTRLYSNRFFQCTEFVKMDSSYLTGDFIIWQNGKQESSRFASVETMKSMRDDILASYGFIFIDQERIENYKDQSWYKPSIESYDEVYAKASEIDKYNLDFLAKLIGPYPIKPS